MISLRLLDEISLDCILRMEHPPEEDFAASNAYSLAQARLHPEKYDTAACDCHPENHRARHVFEKLGFLSTGEVNHGSAELEYRLR